MKEADRDEEFQAALRAIAVWRGSSPEQSCSNFVNMSAVHAVAASDIEETESGLLHGSSG